MFMYLVIGGIVVFLVLARILTWRSDSKGTGRKGRKVTGAYNDPAVGEAKAMRAIRNLSQGPRGR